MKYDIVIRGGTILDGRRTPRYRADIAIRDGVVVSIGRIAVGDALHEIDADGLMVAPGVVDLHTHYDSQIFWDPWCTISGWHGVTSVVVGNCGFGFAPVRPEQRVRAMQTMARNEAVPIECMTQGMPWDWETYPEFLDSIARTPKGVNVMSFLGINPLLVWVMGSVEEAKSRPMTTSERNEVERLLIEAMSVGACGWSAQLLGRGSIQRDHDGTPMITDLMAQEDLIFLAEVLGRIGTGGIQMIGDPGAAEMLAVHSGRPVIYNVLAPTTDQHGAPAQSYKKVIEWLAQTNARGNRVVAQAVTCSINYEFTLEDWNLFDSSPLWRDLTMGTIPERMDKMRDPIRRAALHEEWASGKAPLAGGGTEDREERLGVSLPDLLLAYVTVDDPELRRWEGHSVAEIAQGLGCHPIDALLDISLASDLRAGWQSTPRDIDPTVMKEIATSPYSVPGLSDGGAHTKFLTTGSYPTEFLATWVRDHNVMDLEEAHWRLSAYTAQVAGLLDRGTIEIGRPADIVVYDLEELGLLPTERVYDWPGGAWRRIQKATGWRWTIVNGEITFEDGECSGATPGKLLRHGQAVP
ncbi:MAG: amidohydrolase family protein [Ilumatobacteraceae bacterium]|jgi:N-acyl-D-aspartate/D-glutamate deacylase|nr:amidohydrolase family protein [Ilumatobacteraceae bacterium]